MQESPSPQPCVPSRERGLSRREGVREPERASSSAGYVDPRSSLAASTLWRGLNAANYAVHDVEQEDDYGLAVVGAFVDDAGDAGVVLQGRGGEGRGEVFEGFGAPDDDVVARQTVARSSRGMQSRSRVRLRSRTWLHSTPVGGVRLCIRRQARVRRPVAVRRLPFLWQTSKPSSSSLPRTTSR